MQRLFLAVVLGVFLWRVGRRSAAWQAFEERIKNVSDWFVALSLSATSEFEKTVQG